MKLSERTGWLIANAGSDWIRNLWKGDRVETVKRLVGTGLSEPEALSLADGFHLVEATTYDNADVLPADFIANLKIIEAKKPAIYRRFVLNDWDVSDDEFILIPRHEIEKLKTMTIHEPGQRRLVSCDPSYGGDECVIYAFENSKIIGTKYLYVKDTMKIVGEMVLMASQYNAGDYAVDVIGIGTGIYDRLREMKKKVIGINSAEKATTDQHRNLRAEMWSYVSEKILNGEVKYPEDDELRKQLSSVKYAISSSGQVKLEPKELTKKRLGRSPDRADCYVYGIWALQQVENRLVESEDYIQSDEARMDELKEYANA